MFDEWMTAKREEILAACRAEFAQTETLERMARCVTNFFDDMLRMARSDCDAAVEQPPPSSPPPSSLPRQSIVGTSAVMSRVRIGLNRLSHRSRASVLILGDAGTGRRHCARALHLETYPDGEFFELDDLNQLHELERLLLTRRQHAAMHAAGGLTIYVRELLEAPAKIQEKVAQLLRERGSPLRLVVSSREPLTSQAVRQGRLRPDLLLAFPNEIRLPSLVEREQDVCELAQHFADIASSKSDSPPIRFSPAALARFRSHTWPENVVELVAVVERLSREHGATPMIEDTDLSELDTRASGVSFNLPPAGLDLAVLERDLLTQALAMSANNQTRAAQLLGLTRDQMRYRLAKFEILAAATRAG